MENTKIDWCDSTWNPVTGCLHGCEYCYARRITERFGDTRVQRGVIHELDTPKRYMEENRVRVYPYGFDPTFHRYRLNDYISKKGRTIFVCSMADLFGNWVPDSWIEEVFKACEEAQQHNYLFLTKNPARYVELQSKAILPKKENMWYGASVADKKSWKRVVNAFGDIRCSYKLFVSVEPMLEGIDFTEKWGDCAVINYTDWIIVGAETGRRKDKVVPKREWIERIAEDCRKYGIPLFMKSSLADIWGEPLIQEFPVQLQKGGR